MLFKTPLLISFQSPRFPLLITLKYICILFSMTPNSLRWKICFNVFFVFLRILRLLFPSAIFLVVFYIYSWVIRRIIYCLHWHIWNLRDWQIWRNALILVNFGYEVMEFLLGAKRCVWWGRWISYWDVGDEFNFINLGLRKWKRALFFSF